MDIFSALIPEATELLRNTIAATLQRFGDRALRFAAERGVTIRPLGRGEQYKKASPALARLGIDVDAWPAPPAGLFVVDERTVYIRCKSTMTIAHEFGHALDCTLGNGGYRSGIDPAIRRAFASAASFVTPYAATGIDEYFAEGLRAFVEANDPASHWPRATRNRLQSIDPNMYAYIVQLFVSEFSVAA